MQRVWERPARVGRETFLTGVVKDGLGGGPVPSRRSRVSVPVTGSESAARTSSAHIRGQGPGRDVHKLFFIVLLPTGALRRRT